MIVDRTRSYLLASEPRAAREKSKIMQIKASAHACSQSTTAIPTQKNDKRQLAVYMIVNQCYTFR